MPTRYLKSYFQTVVAAKDRFVTGDKPSQGMFSKLFDSIPFIQSSADTAKTSEQGLAKRATDAQAISKSLFASFTDAMVRFIMPHQLPDVTATDSSITVTEVIWDATDSAEAADVTTNPTHEFRKRYKLQAGNTVSKLLHVDFTDRTTATTVAKTSVHTFATDVTNANKNLTAVGDTMEIDAVFEVDDPENPATGYPCIDLGATDINGAGNVTFDGSVSRLEYKLKIVMTDATAGAQKVKVLCNVKKYSTYGSAAPTYHGTEEERAYSVKEVSALAFNAANVTFTVSVYQDSASTILLKHIFAQIKKA